ncbi:hypothetical protein [Halomonas sp.]|uniref:hypothetical protein n=1 Tax=Halomonas sp. TaxID=1486246 RepID=UPI003F939EC2
MGAGSAMLVESIRRTPSPESRLMFEVWFFKPGVETQLPKLQYQMLKTRVVKKRDEADKEKIGFIPLVVLGISGL